MVSPSEDRVWTGPNILTLSRLIWSAGMFAGIAQGWWWFALAMFIIAAISDWLDGVWARRTNQISAFGRVMDPLIDKVMICGAFVYLLQVPGAYLLPWMVTVILGRELLITGIRGYLEQRGKKFGADWAGKLKMVLQCAYLLATLLILALRADVPEASYMVWLERGQLILLWAMLGMTIFSGVQYFAKAGQALSR